MPGVIIPPRERFHDSDDLSEGENEWVILSCEYVDVHDLGFDVQFELGVWVKRI